MTLEAIVKQFTDYLTTTFNADLGTVTYPTRNGKYRKKIIFDRASGTELIKVIIADERRGLVYLPSTGQIVTTIVNFNKQFQDFIEEMHDVFHVRYRKRYHYFHPWRI